MKKHFKAYASGFDGAAELRQQLMEAKDLAETKNIIDNYLKGHGGAVLSKNAI
jgi:tRNA-dihydrouridine synthase